MSDTPEARSTARIVTDRPERYVKQLVSHLGHKLTTELGEDGVGTISIARGWCRLSPQDGCIDAQASGADSAMLATVEDVVARHLERFAAGEGLTVTWVRASGE